MGFSGFVDADFDAYLQPKWSSNAHNLQRLRVKQKLEELCGPICPTLKGAGGNALAHEFSAERPAIWNQHRVEAQQVFFLRDSTARRELGSFVSGGSSLASLIEDPCPFLEHIFLAVSVDHCHVRVSLELHARALADCSNLESIVGDIFWREKLLACLIDLPVEYALCSLKDDKMRRQSDFGPQQLIEAAATLRSSKRPFVVARSWHRGDPEVATPGFAQSIEQALGKLLPIFNVIAWHRINDRAELSKAIDLQAQRIRANGLKRDDRVLIKEGILSGRIGVVHDARQDGQIKVAVGAMSLWMNSKALAKT